MIKYHECYGASLNVGCAWLGCARLSLECPPVSDFEVLLDCIILSCLVLKVIMDR
jgi:hypothetical protein